MNQNYLPLFQIRMELSSTEIKFVPDINTGNEENFFKYIKDMITYIENMIDVVPPVIQTECINLIRVWYKFS